MELGVIPALEKEIQEGCMLQRTWLHSATLTLEEDGEKEGRGRAGEGMKEENKARRVRENERHCKSELRGGR